MKLPALTLPMKWCVCIFTGLFWWTLCDAQEPGEIDEHFQEFFVNETVFPQERNEIQFTLKPQWSIAENSHTVIPLSAEYGITDRLQAEIEMPYFISPISKRGTFRGVGNVSVGLLYNVMKENRPFSLSVGVEKFLPTAQEDIKIFDEETSWETFVVVARQFGLAQVHINVATEFGEDGAHLNYGIAAIINAGKYKPVLELNSLAEDRRSICYTPGLLYSFRSGVEAGLSVSGSTLDKFSVRCVTAQVVYEF